ncbi:HEAT repeat domain-containing protein [Rivularia sp. UHCC 0363]|uniref:HEAT repeat domain-containing protein n=1 Tax=Rivularia sp. UHCC 0363 TaxID=3110244 RepID=UPI002B1F658D|nr:HEAT repeat domain-containing protein [Rivularia sp. UHCC 0363]MEA5599377.1 HEAT repeat domain-containing protein [Rivularia sp. UHCC 0363]
MNTDIQNLIRAVTEADSSARMVSAVQKLVSAKDTAAIPTLIAVFGYNNPAAAVIAVKGLTELGEVAVPQLLGQIDDYNYGARAYSIRTLAAIADPQALDLLLEAAATDFAPSVRRAAAKGLGSLQWHKLSEQERAIAQRKSLSTLLSITQDADWAIRYAAVVGLQELAKIPILRQEIAAIFSQMRSNDAQPSVRARVTLAQQAS